MSFSLRILLICTGLCFAVLQDTAAQKSNNSASCTVTRNGIKLSWQPLPNISRLRLPQRAGNARLPLHYAVYQVNAAQLKQFMTAAKSKRPDKTEIILPLSGAIGCRMFSVENSGTMSPELEAKYPQLASFKGAALDDKNASIRLDYDGQALHAEIIWQGTYYLIAPWKKGKATYYLVYKKEDSGVQSKPSEVSR